MHSVGACLVFSENSFWCPQGRAELGLGMLTWAAMDTSNGHGYSRGMQCSVNMAYLHVMAGLLLLAVQLCCLSGCSSTSVHGGAPSLVPDQGMHSALPGAPLPSDVLRLLLAAKISMLTPTSYPCRRPAPRARPDSLRFFDSRPSASRRARVCTLRATVSSQ